MRKIALILILFIFCVFSGCVSSKELKDRAIIQAIGIDKQNQQYLLTLQLFYSEGAGGGVSFDPSKSNDKIIQATGDTISEAFKNAAINEGKEIFLSSNKLIIIGQDVAKENMSYPLDFFIKDHESRPNVYIVIAEGTASEIVKLQIKQGIVPANFIESMINASIQSGESQLFTLMDTMVAMQSKTQDMILPIIKKEQDEDKNELVKVSGSGMFRENKLIGNLSVNENIGITLANNQPLRTTLPVHDRNVGKISAILFSNRTKVKVALVDGIPKFTFHITCKAKINETMEKENSNMDMEIIEKIERLISNKLKEYVEKSIEKTATTHFSNLFFLDDHLRQQQPTYWKQNKQHFNRDISKFTFEVKVKTKVDRFGINVKFTENK